MRTGLLLAAASLFLVASVGTIVCHVSGQEQTDEGAPSRLDDLLKQRRDVLAQAVEMLMTQFQEGSCTYEKVAVAQQRLYEAELAAAKTREARVAALEKQRALAEQRAAIADEWFRSGDGTKPDSLLARADLISVEIRLLQERDRAQPNGD